MTEQSPEAEQNLGLLLTQRLAYWNNLLIATSPEDLDVLGKVAYEELDVIWEKMGLMNQPCLVSGTGKWPERVDAKTALALDPDDSFIIDAPLLGALFFKVNRGYAEGLETTSNGFVFESLEPGQRPSLWFLFSLAGFGQSLHQKLSRRTDTVVAFIDPQQVHAVIPVSELTPQIASLSEEAITAVPDILAKRSGEFKDLVVSGAFRKMHHRRQIRQIDTFVEETESQSGVVGLEAWLEARYGYVSRLVNGRVRYDQVDLSDAALRGVCSAITMLGRQRLSTKSIRRDSDLPGDHDALCLSVEVGEGSDFGAGPVFDEGSVLHLPILPQDIEIHFMTTA